jgi:hypothetical protein
MPPTPCHQSITEPTTCRDCGAVAQWHGVQVLLEDGSLRWDTEVECSSCGSATAICGREIPPDTRERMLTAHGPTMLRLRPPIERATTMRVLRQTLGIALADVRVVLQQILAAEYGGTLPETELLARKLRSAGVDAVAVHPSGS